MSIYENYVTILNVNDGAPGEPGAPGKDAQKYRIETNQSEILKFFTQEGAWTFSPNDLIISLYTINSEVANGQSKIELTSISDLIFSVYDISAGWREFILPDNFVLSDDIKYIYYSIESGNIILHLDKLKLYGGSEALEGETTEQYNERINAENDKYQAAKILTSNDTILKLRYEKEESGGNFYFSESLINVRHAMTQDMAKLALKADGIYGSIASTALEFTSNGLTVRNGGFKILNKKSDEVLKADTEGNLIITGEIYATNGKFTGEVQATSGSFNGIIEAKGGSIGGFEISENFLSSKAKNSSTNSSLIVLNGSTGEILAENINLGTGAHIKEYIQLGSFVKIWNPDFSEDGKFIEILDNNSQNAISLKENGSLILGDIQGSYIQLDGKNQEIFAWAQGNTDYTWVINPSEAIFNNITSRGSLKATTFEYGTVQAMGGTLLIRPSSRIKQINNNEIVLETSGAGFYKEDVCVIETSQGILEYYFIDSIQNNIITLRNANGQFQTLSNDYIGSPIINLGKSGAIGIGINGSEIDSYGINSNSISVVEHDGKGVLNSKIILGKLPNNTESFGPAANTYGLYAENVVLNGSLTTKTMTSEVNSIDNSDFSYSGIGTTLGYAGAPTAEKMIDRFPNTNRGQILFWAGAKGANKEQIEASKFFIDQYGNMYAGSGYFEGTIITKSTIEAAEIKTAILTGTGKNYGQNNPALIIRDVSEGIHFYKGKDASATPAFRLSESDFVVDGLKVTLNEKFVITKEGGLELSRIELKDGIIIDGTSIYYPKVGSEIKFTEEANIILKPSSGKEMVISQQGVSINGHLFYMDGTNVEGEYRQIKNDGQVIGYDLYIY